MESWKPFIMSKYAILKIMDGTISLLNFFTKSFFADSATSPLTRT